MRRMWTIAVLLLARGLQGQSSVPALGTASDAGQRMFDQGMKRSLVVTDTVVHETHELGVHPVYPGGDAALLKDLHAERCMPASGEAICQAVAQVDVSFIVERDGRISSPRVENAVCPTLARMALCAIGGLSPFEPGRMGDRVVRARMRLPIRYELR